MEKHKAQISILSRRAQLRERIEINSISKLHKKPSGGSLQAVL